MALGVVREYGGTLVRNGGDGSMCSGKELLARVGRTSETVEQ